MGCHNAYVISAPIEKVWDTIANFHDLSWAPNVVENVDVVGDKSGDQIGAQRVLNGAFHETLLAVDSVDKFFRYSIDDGPGPVAKGLVANYVGTVALHAITENNTTLVMWSSSWTSGDGDIAGFCNPIYQALLGDLKATMG